MIPTPAPLLKSSELLDQPPLSPLEIDRLSLLIAQLLDTSNDIVLFQSEAIVALEAVARNISGPGIRALNVVTGPYGSGFGQWMRQQGSKVTDVSFPFDRVADSETVIARMYQLRPHVVSLVHAEAATGGTNNVAPILEAARESGAITVLDAVASIGAEAVPTDSWAVDIVAVGGQKALAGPAGISAVSVSQKAWEFIDANPTSMHGSVLSLTDWRDSWLRSDHTEIPGLPNWLEGRAFLAALERVLDEGLDSVNARHHAASYATRVGADALGLRPWQTGDSDSYAPIATALRLDNAPQLLSLETPLVTQGNGVLRGEIVRVNHYGLSASLEGVQSALNHIGDALGRSSALACQAAATAWQAKITDASE